MFVYTASCEIGYIGVFSSLDKIHDYVTSKYYIPSIFIQKFEVDDNTTQIYVIPLRDVNLPIIVSSDREYCEKKSCAYKRMKLIYEDDIEYYLRDIDTVHVKMIVIFDRLYGNITLDKEKLLEYEKMIFNEKIDDNIVEEFNIEELIDDAIKL